MRASKAEIAAYVIGGLTIIGGLGVWHYRRKKHPGDIYPQMFIFGAGLLLTGGALSIHRATTRKALGGGLGLAEVARSRSRSGATTRLWSDPNMDVQERVVLLQDLVAKSVRDPDVRRLALAVTGHGKRKIQVGREMVDVKGRGCEARDDNCELEAIFDFASNPKNLRYTGDTGAHVVVPGQEPEAVDFFATVRRAIENRGEDCDGHSVVTTTLAALNGFPVRFRITSNTGATWDHIYGLAGVPKLDPKKWIPLDTTLGPNKFGIEPGYAKHVDFDA